MRKFWFGASIDMLAHVHLAQLHSFDFTLNNGQVIWIAEMWVKGMSGKLWAVTRIAQGTRQECEAAVAAERATTFARYITIMEGTPYWAEEPTSRQSQFAAGAAAPDWWATILGVSPDAPAAEVKAAYRARVRATHPDLNPTMDGSEFIQVHSAWEFYQSL